MDKKEVLSLIPCYKLNFDKSQIKMSEFLDKISNYGDFLLYDDYIYIWLDVTVTKDKLIRSIKRMGISEIYCEHIKFDLSQYPERDTNHLVVWWAEHYNKNLSKLIEMYCQNELNTIQDNIQKASALLDERIAEAKINNGGF